MHLSPIWEFEIVVHIYGGTGEMAYMSDSHIKSNQVKLPPDTYLADAFDKTGQGNIIWQCSSNSNLLYQMKENNYVQ